MVEPGLDLVMATFGAESVFAGVIAIAIGVAVFAEINFAAKILGTTVGYILHGPLMAGQKAVAELVQIGLAMQAEDVGQFERVIRDDRLTGPP
jgi:hypothetical protein